MNDILERIINKPESTRKKIGFAAVVFLTTIILSIWWMTFSLKPTASAITEDTNSAVASPFAITWNSLKNTLRLNPIFNK